MDAPDHPRALGPFSGQALAGLGVAGAGGLIVLAALVLMVDSDTIRVGIDGEGGLLRRAQLATLSVLGPGTLATLPLALVLLARIVRTPDNDETEGRLARIAVIVVAAAGAVAGLVIVLGLFGLIFDRGIGFGYSRFADALGRLASLTIAVTSTIWAISLQNAPPTPATATPTHPDDVPPRPGWPTSPPPMP